MSSTSSRAVREYDYISILWQQSRIQKQVQIAVKSLDIVLGLVGGLSGIIWGFLSLCLDSYSSFALQTTMVKSLYTATAPKSDDDDPVAPRDAVVSAIADSSKPYSYSYLEYVLAKFLDSICGLCLRNIKFCQKCFQKRSERLYRHYKASERLEEEIDVVKLA